jgi:hypothetical protein
MDRYILIVEDDEIQMRRYKDQWNELGTGIGILLANSLQTAMSYYDNDNGQIVGMIIDGAVPGSYLTTIPFIQMVRADRFPGIMVAASTRADYRKTMVQYGCTHESEKRYAVKQLAKALTPQ